MNVNIVSGCILLLCLCLNKEEIDFYRFFRIDEFYVSNFVRCVDFFVYCKLFNIINVSCKRIILIFLIWYSSFLVSYKL